MHKSGVAHLADRLTARAAKDPDLNAIGGEATCIVGLDTYEQHVTDQFDRRVFLAVAPGRTATEIRPLSRPRWPRRL